MISILFVIYSLMILSVYSQSTNNNDNNNCSLNSIYGESQNQTETVQDVDPIIKLLLNTLKTVANNDISDIIKAQHLDPWNHKFDDTVTQRINIDICEIVATAQFSINNIEGLSSIYIENITGKTETVKDEDIAFTAFLSLSLNKELTAKIEGSVGGKCGILKVPTPKITGTVKISGINIVSDININGYINSTDPEVGITAAQLQNMKAIYNPKNFVVDIDGLGVFNELLQPLIDGVDTLFKTQIYSLMTSVLSSEVNKAIIDQLPFTHKI